MSLATWWLFLSTVFVLCAVPGPNMLHIMGRSVELGVKRSVLAMLGCLSAMGVVLLASAVGLTAFLLAVPAAFEILRYGGAAYLIYLGVRAWRAEVSPVDVGVDTLLAPSFSVGLLFRGGFAVGISNPKLLLFAAAFLPQFVNPSRAHGPQFAVLIVTFMLAEMFWYAVYALGGQSLSRFLVRPAMKRLFNRVTGGIFVGFGVLLLRVRVAGAT
ncbi:LysE family translocator [Acetobacter fallax]|uniref:LysE family translocator n=1 Tax=Acetobacter fallax TaxID=1737473 RepID=A0ABX0KBH3_9PROT|nr:LysE family translocator [Acetobacter fallax]NHO33787.1 LysE family translocator [Acetobacter fallax]NHO37348.1 LysE family translocator [Acetobacter fallax]